MRRPRWAGWFVPLLVMLALSPDTLAADAAGCADPAWAPKRLPGFAISACRVQAWVAQDVSLPQGRKSLEGRRSIVSYTLTDPGMNPTAAVARAHQVQQAESAGATLVSGPGDGYRAVLTAPGPNGDAWYIYQHGSGNDQSTGSYTLTTVVIAPFPQEVEARPLQVPLDTQATQCKDPPWLVRQFAYFKLTSCNNRDYDTVKLKLPGGGKTLAGHVLETRYTLTERERDPVALFVMKNYRNALQTAGATLASAPGDVYNAVWTQQTPLGEVWYAYTHTSGNENSTGSYSLVTLLAGGPPPRGCTIEVYGVNFDFDKATLRPESEPVLNAVLALFRDDAAYAAEVGGHTDNAGAAAYNMKLSGDRANAVKAWLLAHGVLATRLSAHGYGATRPLVPNTTDENRFKNRRVELRRANCKP